MTDFEDVQVMWTEKVFGKCVVFYTEKKGRFLVRHSKLQRSKNRSLKITFWLCYFMTLYIRVKGIVQGT